MISQNQETTTELKTLQESDLQLSPHLPHAILLPPHFSPPALPLTMLNPENTQKFLFLVLFNL